MWRGGRTITFIILSCIVKALLGGGGQNCLLAKGKKLHPSVLLKKHMAFSLCRDADQYNTCARDPAGHVLETPHWPWQFLVVPQKSGWGNHTYIYTWFVKKMTAVPVSNHLEIDKRTLNYMCANWVFIRVMCIPWCRRGRTWWLCYSDMPISHVK